MEDNSLLRTFRTSGFCVIDNVIPADRCDEIRSSVEATVKRECGEYASPQGVDFVPGLINHDQSFAPYLAEPRLLEFVQRVLGEQVRISFTSAIINQPGNVRGKWHADWPFNQNNAGHVPAPYGDAVLHLTTLWMLSPFDAGNGGTLVVPGSHRISTNPTDSAYGVDAEAPHPQEVHAAGAAGSVLVFDSRLWHTTAPNNAPNARVALAVRYAPWWLNLEVLRPESDLRKQMVTEPGASENLVPSVNPAVFDKLPANVQPLYRHWIQPQP